jgi:uncharacterized membrane protein (UPF0127 family)
MKKKIIFASALVVLIILLGSREAPLATQNPTLTIGDTKIAVEIADTEATRTRGLSGRASLAENTGLLFIFNRADYYGFWMEEMNFPIDIIWLDNNWRVVDITINALPQNFPTTYQPRAPARYVLEVNAGFITTHHITIGTQAVLR